MNGLSKEGGLTKVELTKKNWSSSRGKNKGGPVKKGGLRGGCVGGEALPET